MAKAVLYARVSSDRQEREGFSIPAQLELLRAYAARHGFEIAQEYTEAETAKKAGRAQWNAMMGHVLSKDGPRVVLVEKVDRLLRNFTDFVAVETAAKHHGVAFHLVKEHEVLDGAAGSNAWFMFTIKASVAKWYIDNLGEETRKGMYQRAKEGLHNGPRPLGYRGVKGGILEPDPDRAPMVQRAYQLYATSLYSLEETRQALKREGWPLLSHARMEWMLKNPIYKGVIEFNGEQFAGKHVPIIDLATWQAVQYAFRRDGKPVSKRKHTMRYQGAIKCGACGGSVTGDSKKGGKYTYWRCSNAMGATSARTCDEAAVNQTVIDAEFESLLKSIRIREDYKASILRAMEEMEGMKEEETARHEAQLKRELTKARNTLKQAYKDKLAGLVDVATYEEVAGEYQRKIETLEARVGSLGQAELGYYDLAVKLFELPERLASGWIQADEADKRELVGILTSNATLQSKTITLELNPLVAFMVESSKTEQWWPSLDEVRTVIKLHAPTIQAMSTVLAA